MMFRQQFFFVCALLTSFGCLLHGWLFHIEPSVVHTTKFDKLGHGFVRQIKQSQLHYKQYCKKRLICYSKVKPLWGQKKVEWEPEPEGGIELTPRTSMPGCRVKQMEVMTKIKTDDGRPAYKFWMEGIAQGALIKEIRTQILKDASKKANFPGFRKGQVPPYAQPQITQFSLQEAIIKTVEAAVDSYGLKSLSGSDGEVKVHEDVTEMAKGYKIGDSVKFTATLNAAYDPEMIQPLVSTDASDTVVVDVESVLDELPSNSDAVDVSSAEVESVDSDGAEILATNANNVGPEAVEMVEDEPNLFNTEETSVSVSENEADDISDALGATDNKGTITAVEV